MQQAESAERTQPSITEPLPPRLLVVIVCYKAPELTLDCLRSLEPEIQALPGARVAICENGTGEESARIIAEGIEAHGWSDWVEMKVIHPNRGFSGGNNVILSAAMASEDPPERFLLLNADTIVRPGALVELMAAADRHPEVGILGPRLEWPDGKPQISAFLDRAPTHEFFVAAATGVLEKILGARGGVIPMSEEPIQAEWVSFACALIRREVLQNVGLLDEGFYLYFDDPDLCRRTREAGWQVLYWPDARVVHLRGQSNPQKELAAKLKRPPKYWYESRTRYYAKYYGRLGPILANVAWTLGRAVSWVRELLGTKKPHICEGAWRDIWTNWRDPLRMPTSRQDD